MLKLPQLAKDIIDKLAKNGFEAYAVGGSIRDILLGRPTKDWDFTTNATPTNILDIFPDSFYDNNFGTVGIQIKSENEKHIYEITTYRTEVGYKDNRHPDVILWGTKLEEDLARRDFTINAIASDGKILIDPYKGQEDLKNRLIRTVGDPNERFAEDALRLLRAIRIAATLGFTIEESTFIAIKQNAHLIKYISADRIRMELMKLLASDFPAEGIMILKNAGLLSFILPELEKAFNVPQKSPGRHHIDDVGTHLVKSLNHTPAKDPLVRFATLIHDIGKPVVFKKSPQELITFYNHEVIGASIADNIAMRLNFSKKDREKLVILVRWHQFTVDEEQTDATLRRFISHVGKENLKDILDLRIGDRLGGGAQETSWRLRLFIKRLEEVQKQPFTVADLKVDGYVVMKLFSLSPGPRIGKILDELFNEVIAGKLKNEKEPLLERLDQIKKAAY